MSPCSCTYKLLGSCTHKLLVIDVSRVPESLSSLRHLSPQIAEGSDFSWFLERSRFSSDFS